MDTQRWQRIAVIFDDAIETQPEARAQLLDRLCAGDGDVRREVEAMLAADLGASQFDTDVDSARNSAVVDWADTDERDSVRGNERFGPWRMLSELGRGGMGVVWLAERADGQFEQHAALKLIKRGMDSEALIARFLRERQILARLEHPNIARLLDGGIGDDGRPYFAMEYVAGEGLLRYCAERDLKLEARIELFLQICAAVQFAHAQLVVHRDIKPSNVLITAGGDAKLLDFGIAKLLDEAGDGETTMIDAPHRPLTVAYAAPEQLRGEAVTTATDIYALGGVLYELLTGRRALAAAEGSTLQQMLQAHTTTDPAAPSRVVAADAAISARRLRGDLDTIVLKALQREPQRRYATVAAFADDLQRFLSGQPIQARRDHNWYRVGKFIGRHRVGVFVATAGVLVLVAALLLALWQASEKAHQAQVSQQVTQFLTGLFHGADPTLTHGATVTAQDLLDRGAQRLREDARMEPAVKARLLHTVAATYTDLGLYDRALPLEQQALQLRRARLRPQDPEIADSLDQLGRIYTEKADYAKAESLLRDALTLRSDNLPADDPAIIDSLGNLGQLLQDRGDFAGADGPFRQALADSERRFGAGSAETAHQLDNLATNEDNLGKSADAVAMYRRALAIREKVLGPNDAEVATSLINLGTHLDDAGNHDDALKLLERARAIRLKIYGPEHPLVGYADLSLAGVYDSETRLADAERTANDALVIFRRTLPADHRKISETLNLLAILRTEHRDFAGAVPLFRDVLTKFQHTLGADHPDTLAAQNNLAATLLHAGQFAEAEKLQRNVLERAQPDNGQGLVATNCENLSITLEQEGKFTEAIAFARRALEIQIKREGKISGNVAVALRGVAIAEAFAGNTADAERDFRATLRMGEKLKVSQGIDLFQWQLPLADFLVGAGECSEAVPLLQSVVAALNGDANLVSQLEAKLLLGHCQVAGEHHAAGIAMDAAARRALRAIPGVEVDLYPTAGKMLSGEGVTPAQPRATLPPPGAATPQ